MKRPPAAASKIVTLTISPIPKWKARGGRRSGKEFENLGSYRPSGSGISGGGLRGGKGVGEGKRKSRLVWTEVFEEFAGEPNEGVRERVDDTGHNVSACRHNVGARR